MVQPPTSHLSWWKFIEIDHQPRYLRTCSPYFFSWVSDNNDIGWHWPIHGSRMTTLIFSSSLLITKGTLGSRHQSGPSIVLSSRQIPISHESFNGLTSGKIYRKPWIFQWNMGFSCNFSLKPINWIFPVDLCWDFHDNVAAQLRPSSPHVLQSFSQLFPGAQCS